MKRKYLLLVVIVILFQTCVPSFLYAKDSNEGKNKSQPEACSWPTEMMSNYFNFQYEVISLLFWSKLNERTLRVSFTEGLFSKKILELSAIDVLASNLITNVISPVSNLLTSAVLILLASKSVVESNIEWFAILFKDRPVVRDFKEMLDIETQLFDVAYFRSKEMNITRPFEWSWDFHKEFYKIIDKYEKNWLLEQRVVSESNIPSVSMVDILSDLLEMNAVMKRFIADGGTGTLGGYNWCLWSSDFNNCNENNSLLRFSQSAINQLDKDYKAVRSFSACNSYANFFRNSIGKTVDSSKESVKTSVQDVKDSMNRLWGALIGKNGTWNLVKGPCDGISDYEMAQLRAYWWPNWTCWEWVNLSSMVSGVSSFLSKTKEYFRQIKAKRKNKEKMKKEQEEERNKNLLKITQSNATTSEKMFQWYKNFWSETKYNPEFSMKLYSGFVDIYEETIKEYWEALETATDSDTSVLLKSKGKWILDQMDTIMKNGGNLEKALQKIVDKQCSG